MGLNSIISIIMMLRIVHQSTPRGQISHREDTSVVLGNKSRHT